MMIWYTYTLWKNVPSMSQKTIYHLTYLYMIYIYIYDICMIYMIFYIYICDIYMIYICIYTYMIYMMYIYIYINICEHIYVLFS